MLNIFTRCQGVRFWICWLGVYLATALVLVCITHPQHPTQDISGIMSLKQGVFSGHDTLTHDYPAWMWGWSEVRRTGMIPLWNPSWFGGEAFIASQTFMAFYPFNWLGGIFALPLGFNIQYPLHLVLAAMVMAWTCRRRGLHPVAAGMAGLAWGFGSHLASLIGPGHLQKIQALAWLPLVVWGAGHIMRSGAGVRRSWLPLTLGLTMQITAGHLQIVYLSLVAGCLESIASIGIHYRENVRQIGSFMRGLLRPAGSYLFAGVLAFGLSAVFLLPTIEFAKLSNRGEKLSWEEATRGSLVPEEIFEFILPRLRGDSMPHGRGYYFKSDDRVSMGSSERIVSDYAGAAVILFVIIGLIGPCRRVRLKVLLYTLLGFLGLTMSLGKYLPGFYRLLYEYLPGIAHFRSPWTSAALLAFGLTMAAAFGLSWYMDALEQDQKRKCAAKTLTAVTMLCLFSVFLFNHYCKFSIYGYPGLFSGGLWVEGVTKYGMFRYDAFHHLSLGLLGGLVALAGLFFSTPSSGRIFVKMLKTACVGLLICFSAWDLLGNHHVFWNSSDSKPYHLFLKHHWAERIWDKEPGPVRMLQTDSVLSNRPLTLTDFRRKRVISSVHGYHPVAYGAYSRLFNELGYLHPGFLRLFGVNYLVMPGGQRDVPDGYMPVMASGSHVLYHNPGQQYVRAVRHLSVVRDMDSVIRIMKDKTFDPYNSSLATTRDVNAKLLGIGGQFPDMQLQYQVETPAPGEIRLDLKTRNEGLVVVSEPAVPGWRMKMNGHSATSLLTRLDGYFLAFPVVPGPSHVELSFDPVSQRLGLYLTCLSLGLLVFLLARREQAVA
jgi:hypothetical protein